MRIRELVRHCCQVYRACVVYDVYRQVVHSLVMRICGQLARAQSSIGYAAACATLPVQTTEVGEGVGVDHDITTRI